MRLWFFLAATALASTPVGAVTQPVAQPSVRVADAQSLDNIIQFGPPARPSLKRGGEIYWGVDIDLPPRASIKGIKMPGFAPVFLTLDGGRCFRIDVDATYFNGAYTSVTPSITSDTCRSDVASNAPAAIPSKPGLQYIGKAWNLIAWRDKNTGKTSLIEQGDPRHVPALTTSMRVIAVGGMGSPDSPTTEVSLVGYVGKQLTLVTVILYIP